MIIGIPDNNAGRKLIFEELERLSYIFYVLGVRAFGLSDNQHYYIVENLPEIITKLTDLGFLSTSVIIPVPATQAQYSKASDNIHVLVHPKIKIAILAQEILKLFPLQFPTFSPSNANTDTANWQAAYDKAKLVKERT
jgi:hypothetical protein